jgi:hypothetical protein
VWRKHLTVTLSHPSLELGAIWRRSWSYLATPAISPEAIAARQKIGRTWHRKERSSCRGERRQTRGPTRNPCGLVAERPALSHLRVLKRIHELAASGRVRFTLKALRELASLDVGLDEADGRELLQRL